tara:strand:+ start:859 stop:2250 length:1392 start_codon:yes stop_codon:yes gene_type:complete
VQGTILILDGVATNRIILKVQLSAAYYRIVQGTDLVGLRDLVRRTRPDLIVTAMKLPDGTAEDVKKILSEDPPQAAIPILAIGNQRDRMARLKALAAGIDDVLEQPLNDLVFQARIRSLLRLRDGAEDLPAMTGEVLGFAEAPTAYSGPSRVALVTAQAETGTVWRSQLASKTRHSLRTFRLGDIQGLMTQPVPDAIVIEIPRRDPAPALSLMSELFARSSTANCVVIALAEGAEPHSLADALDRGAQDVMAGGFDAEELALRLELDLARKARRDRLRSTVRAGLRAAVLDPMTGLYNRRYALPYLTSALRDTIGTRGDLALMMADLDHFKQINDHYGHAAGDAVLIETAQRLRLMFEPDDMIARVGGEEFLIAIPGVKANDASRIARRICAEINGRPFRIAGAERPVDVTISVGVVTISAGRIGAAGTDEQLATRLIDQADQALYQSKAAGRNRFKTIEAAA